jgi:hypothetical protein
MDTRERTATEQAVSIREDTVNSEQREIPVFKVVPTGPESVRFVEPCPYCAYRHIHGIKSVGGHVAAHCYPTNELPAYQGMPGETRPKARPSPLHETGYYLEWAREEFARYAEGAAVEQVEKV